jgi:drug/metabolite transporter (DMT)-like permease
MIVKCQNARFDAEGGAVTWANYMVLTACVLAISSGQLLFKVSASAISHASLRDIARLPSLPGTLMIHGMATAGWIWQLQRIELSRAYPFMALRFVLVPLLSAVVLKETVDTGYWAGTLMMQEAS